MSEKSAARTETEGAKVINMSLGGTGTNYLEQEAINDAVAKGVTVVVAAGNDNYNAGNNSPACLDNVITVAAAEDEWNAVSRCSFSNYGDVVDITAPGGRILSSVIPEYDEWEGCVISYDYMSGTSMAAPHVAAAAALLLTVHADYTPAEVEMRLKQAATIEVEQYEYYLNGESRCDGIDVPNMLSMESLIDTEVSSDIEVSISRETATCYVGQSFPLEAASTKGAWDISWSISDDSIAYISGNMVSCLDEGKVTITASSIQNPAKTASCEITVVKEPEIMPGEDLLLPVDGSEHMLFTTNCDPAPEMSWSVSDPSVAQLYEYEGVEEELVTGDLTTTSGIYIKGLRAGTTTLTAAVVNEYTGKTIAASCKVTVENTDWYDESIEEYHIASVEDMLRLTRLLGYGSIEDEMEGKTVYLDKSLDLSGSDFFPISSFAGTFDGQGNTITIVMEDVTGNYDGLFGSLSEGALVKNLNLNATITSTETMDRVYMGGITAYNEGAIESCVVSGTISAKNRDYVGGIAGYSTGTITDCFNDAAVSGKRYVGGISGYSKNDITNCENDAKIWGRSYVGGIVGSSAGMIRGCINVGEVTQPSVDDYDGDHEAWIADMKTDDGMYTGGIAGYSTTTISDCENVGFVYGSIYVGGISGRLRNWSLECCFNSGDVIGIEYVGGICGDLFEADLTSCQNGGFINGVGNYVGGICGRCDYDYGYGYKISDCTNTGPVTGNGYVGGICACSGYELLNCVNSGDITWCGATDEYGYVGGIAGSSIAYNCINYGTVLGMNSNYSGKLNIGGICGSSYTVENCFNAGALTVERNSNVYLGGVCGYLSHKMGNSYATDGKLYGGAYSDADVENSSLCVLSGGKYILNDIVTAGNYVGTDLLEAMNAYVLQEYENGGVYNEGYWEREMFELCFWEKQSGILVGVAGVVAKSDSGKRLAGTFSMEAAENDDLLLTAACYRDGKMVGVECTGTEELKGYILWLGMNIDPADELKVLITDQSWRPWSGSAF